MTRLVHHPVKKGPICAASLPGCFVALGRRPAPQGRLPRAPRLRANPLAQTSSCRFLFCPRITVPLRICCLPRRIRPPFYGAPYLALERLDLDLPWLRCLSLRELQGQNAVFQLSLHFRGVCGNRKPHHAAEGADGALAAHVKRSILLHAL